MYPVKPVTLDDVARAAGVSRSTVSQVLSDTGRVSAETRARVSRIADELGYVVNIGARNLRMARAGAIGLCLPPDTMSLAYYMEVTFGILERAEQEGLSVTLLSRADRSLQNAHVDGYIVVDPELGEDSSMRILRAHRLVVSGERAPDPLPAPAGSVESDHRAAMTALLDHLHAQGARRIAVILPGVGAAWSEEIREAYLEWMAGHGLEPKLASSPRRIGVTDVHRITNDLLAGQDRPDAIISTPDGSAPGAIAAAKALGLVVGADVLVAGYGDSASLQMSDPPVTAVDLRPRVFGFECADLLIALLGNRALRANRVRRNHRIELRVRASSIRVGSETRGPAVGDA